MGDGGGHHVEIGRDRNFQPGRFGNRRHSFGLQQPAVFMDFEMQHMRRALPRNIIDASGTCQGLIGLQGRRQPRRQDRHFIQMSDWLFKQGDAAQFFQPRQAVNRLAQSITGIAVQLKAQFFIDVRPQLFVPGQVLIDAKADFGFEPCPAGGGKFLDSFGSTLG